MQALSLSPEHETFWEAIGFLFAPDHWAQTPTDVDHILARLRLQPPATVLDLCCGLGRHSLEFARREFKVTGVDKTSAYLASAVTHVEAAGLTVEFVHEDMRTFCRPEAFEAAVNLLTSFGYFENPEEDRQVARNVYQSLKPGGSFLVELMGKEVLARGFQARDWSEIEGTLLLQERTIINNWGAIENRWIIVRDQSRTELRFSHRLYSAEELTALLRGCGFSAIEVYGDLAGRAYDHGATRLVVVARK